jgi:hypothetical protein
MSKSTADNYYMDKVPYGIDLKFGDATIGMTVVTNRELYVEGSIQCAGIINNNDFTTYGSTKLS